MKADIDENGTLSVIPQSPLESYALNKWFQNYTEGSGDSTLHISSVIQEPVDKGQNDGG